MKNTIRVFSIQSSNGNDVPNQFIIKEYNKQGDIISETFQSYNSIIAKRDFLTGKVEIDKQYWNYSRTTGKYRNMFLIEDTKETQKKINSGEYKFTNLN